MEIQIHRNLKKTVFTILLEKTWLYAKLEKISDEVWIRRMYYVRKL